MDLIQLDNNLEKELRAYCSQHTRGIKVSENPKSLVRQTIYITNSLMLEQHNAVPYFITVTFPHGTASIPEAWRATVEFAEAFKKEITQKYTVVSGIIAVEPHKNNNLKRKGAGNQNAGYPHLHMVLWITHPFLNPTLNHFREMFADAHMVAKVERLKTNLNALKAILYTIKESSKRVPKKMCKTFTTWKRSVNFWCNQSELRTRWSKFAEKVEPNNAFYSEELYLDPTKIPTTRFHDDKAILLGELFFKLFLLHDLALREDHVYQRVPNTVFSWRRVCSLGEWIQDTFHHNAPPKYMELLRENINWIVARGKQKKSGTLLQNLFPNLRITFYIVEALDMGFDLNTGKCFQFSDVDQNKASVCYVKKQFHQITPPTTLLGMLYSLVNYGRDQFQEKSQFNNLPVPQEEVAKRKHIEEVQQNNELFQQYVEVLERFGGIIHYNRNRKENKILYLLGQPNTFKTFILSLFFETLVGKEHVDLLARNKSRFNLGDLRKPNDEPFHLLIDDFRWEALGIPEAEFLNLIDGKWITTENKFMSKEKGELKGAIAATANVSISRDNVDYQQDQPFHARFAEVTLWPLREQFHVDEQFIKRAQEEAIGFAILTNALYLKKILGHDTTQLDLPLSFYPQPQTEAPRKQEGEEPPYRNTFQSAGEGILQQLVKDFSLPF